MDLQALLQMFLDSEAAEGSTKTIFTNKIQAFAAEHGFEISDAQIAQGLEILQNLYAQYKNGEQMDLSSVASAFCGNENNGLASLASMFMGGQEQGQGNTDVLQMLNMLQGGENLQGGMDLASMGQMLMNAQGQQQGDNGDMAQLAQMFMNNMNKE
ncbi:MAG: hypothetical protein Q4D21_09350 [Phascolarctobacterium sp.]|nr:hypothetical protein [Phascolarctobacterium sp.]